MAGDVAMAAFLTPYPMAAWDGADTPFLRSVCRLERTSWTGTFTEIKRRRFRERVGTKDRQWFTAHSGQYSRVRAHVAGTLSPGARPAARDVGVLRSQIAPAMRLRTGVLPLVKSRARSMIVIEPSAGSALSDVVMEGVDS